HGHWRWMGRRPIDDFNGRPGHLADAGIHRTGVLRRDPHRHIRHYTGWSEYRIADPDTAVGHSFAGLLFARRYKTYRVVACERRGMFHDGIRSFRPDGTLPDSHFCDERSRSRHEQLDVGSVQVSQKEVRSWESFDGGRPPETGQLPAIRRR